MIKYLNRLILGQINTVTGQIQTAITNSDNQAWLNFLSENGYNEIFNDSSEREVEDQEVKNYDLNSKAKYYKQKLNGTDTKNRQDMLRRVRYISKIEYLTL
jgi:Skp family chaperone for outer membrane proteins